MAWYRQWHSWRLHHHFHVAMLALYIVSIFIGLLATVYPSEKALASTSYTWNLNTASEYTYNPSYIQFSGGVAQATGYTTLPIYAYDMFCTSSSTCFVIGEYGGGKVYKTTNGGETWTAKNPTGTVQILQASYFVNANVGYVVGNNAYVRKTINGGDSWTTQTLPPEATGKHFYGVYCKDPEGGPAGNVCYAVGGGSTDGASIIIKTTDGANWSLQTHNTTGYNYLGDIFCTTDSDHCYAAGHNGKIFKTEDGGTNWNPQTSGTSTSAFTSISCLDGNTCYIAGSSGTILKTTDGGTNWLAQDSENPTAFLRDIQFTDNQTGYAIGYIGTNGLILKTTDAGANWTTSWVAPSLSSYLYGIHCLDVNLCYIAGFNQYKTVNAGSGWLTMLYQPIPTVVPNASYDYTNLVGFKETNGTGSVGTIHYQVSNDDGATWYWYNSQNSAWEVAYDGYYHNTASEINSNITTFTGSFGAGTGKFKWKAVYYLESGGNQLKLDSIQISLKGNTPNKPESLTISDVSNRDNNVWALALSWDSPLPGGEINFFKIERSENGGPWTAVGTTNDGTKRAYAEVVPSSEVTYSYRVRAVDHDEVGGIYDDESEPSNVVSMMPTGKYSGLPSLIDAPTVTTTATSANISWSTDRVSSSTVKYSTDTSYTFIASSPQMEVTSHSVSLKGLLPGTTYHFKVQSLDTERTYGTDVYYNGEYALTTPSATEISGLKIYDILSGSALVSWQTSTDMTTTLHYGKDNNYGTTIEGSSGTSHVAKLTGLQDDTTYHLKVSGTDAGGNSVHSDDYSFETLALPKVTNVKFEELRDRPSATIKITWETNTPTSSVVEYSDSEGKTQEVSAYQLVTKHEMVTSGLKDRAEYTMVIKGRDAFGNEVTAAPQKVKTDIDVRPPEISEITTETSINGYGANAKSQMIVSWSTDEPATSQVEYSKGGSGKNLNRVTQEDAVLTTSHAVIITNLEPSSSYYFRIISKDNSKNEAKSEINSGLTDQIRPSVFDIIIKSFSSTFDWLFGAERVK